MTQTPLRILGAPGSPYSRKLRAVLRYRRIPYAWLAGGAREATPLPKPRVQLLPQLFLEGEDGKVEARIDSTPLIRELESRYPDRSVIPPDPAVAFLDALLEDYADEWLTKAMFHYRWAYPADIANAGALLPRWGRTDQPEEEAVALGKSVSERQIERLWVVGSNEKTTPIIEASYRRLLTLLASHLTGRRFVFGGRPGAADFGLFGQLTQLVQVDPTPMAIARSAAPRICAWVDIVEDLSGLEPTDADWLARDAIPASLIELLREVGRVYAPFLLANAAALERGAERVTCTIDGQPWEQRPFPYQGKCLRSLRDQHAALPPDARAHVDALLADTGCESLF